MSSSWLKMPREAKGFTQEALAAAIGQNPKTIQRLERCDPDTPKWVPYAQIAKILGVAPVQLAEEHARDLSAANLPEQAKRASDAADKLRREDHFPSVAPGPIEAALAACRATGLVGRIAERPPSLTDETAQAQHMAKLLEEGRLDAFANLVDLPLEETIAQAASADQLGALERFLRAILGGCAAKYDGLDPGQWHQHHGESKAWPFRLLIDRAQQLDGMQFVRPAPDTAEARLDDSRGVTRAVRSGHVSQINPDGRVHQLVCGIADTLGTVDPDRPAAGDAKALADFCKTVNNELFRHNSRHSHVFGLWDRCTCEAEEVKEALLLALPYFRVFDTGDPTRASTVLRADSGTLETWYASHLRAIDGRLETLPPVPTPPLPSTTSPESRTMDASNNAPIQVSVVVGDHGRAYVNQAAGQAQAHQHNLGNPSADLLPLLQILLAETGTGDSRYADLRKACRNAQGELEEAKALSGPTKTLLQRTIEALPTADKAIDIATKVADLVAKMPGLGT